MPCRDCHSFFFLLSVTEMDEPLPPGVIGAAVGVLVYSFICLACGFFLLWLVWVHDERRSCK